MGRTGFVERGRGDGSELAEDAHDLLRDASVEREVELDELEVGAESGTGWWREDARNDDRK